MYFLKNKTDCELPFDIASGLEVELADMRITLILYISIKVLGNKGTLSMSGNILK